MYELNSNITQLSLDQIMIPSWKEKRVQSGLGHIILTPFVAKVTAQGLDDVSIELRDMSELVLDEERYNPRQIRMYKRRCLVFNTRTEYAGGSR